MLDIIRNAIGLGCSEKPVPGRKRVELVAAMILVEAAASDYDCSDAEIGHVLATMREMFGLNVEQARELMDAADAGRADTTDLHSITRKANEAMSRVERLAVLDAVWRVIYADGVIDRYEEHFARKLTDLLLLDHADFIEARRRARPGGGDEEPTG